MSKNLIIKEYFNPEKAKELDKGPDYPGTIKLQCYDRCVWKVCPNPMDKKRADSIEEQYNSGHFISRETYYVSKEDFDNLDNWNS